MYHKTHIYEGEFVGARVGNKYSSNFCFRMIMDMEKTIRFRLDRIEELAYTLNLNSVPENINGDLLYIQFICQTFLNESSGEVKLRVGTKYNLADVNIMSLELMFIFYIDDMASFVTIDKEENQLNFKADLIPTFMNVAFGGMRGVLYEKTKGSVLSKYPLPLIDMADIMKWNTFHVEPSM